MIAGRRAVGPPDRRARSAATIRRALAVVIGLVLLSGVSAVATHPDGDLAVGAAGGERHDRGQRPPQRGPAPSSSASADAAGPDVADGSAVAAPDPRAERATERTRPVVRVVPAPPSSTPPRGAAPASTSATTSTTSVPADRLPLQPAGPEAVVGQGEQGRWWADHNGYHAEIVMEPAHPRAGDLVTFRFVVSHDRYACCGYGMTAGDEHSACGHHHCEPTWFDHPGFDDERGCGDGSGGSATLTWQHTYNRPGRWVGQFTAQTAPICGGPESTPELNVQVWIEVAEGRPPTAQGPKLPFGTFNHTGVRYQDDGSYVYDLYLEGRDEDGDVRRFEIDWGDGSPVEVVDVDDDHCPVRASGWTDSSMTATVPHRYTAGPRPPITVIVTSTGCDASAPQSAQLRDDTGQYPADPGSR